MALPQTQAEVDSAIANIIGMSCHTVADIYRMRDGILAGPPKLRGWWFRQWCALRGHGGITHYPGSSTYYLHEGLCKRCGDRVNCS